MRLFHRAVATAVAGLAFAAAGVVGAAPALATPEDGEGCVGSPDVRASYICVISLTPENAVPATTTTNIPVTVPRVCYVAGCTDARVVNVPVAGVAPREGVVAVLWHQGQYIPISVGTSDLMVLVNDAIDLALAVAGNALGTVNGVVADVNQVIQDLPSSQEIRQMVNDAIADALYPYQETVDSVRDFVNLVVDNPRILVDIVKQLIGYDELMQTVRDVLAAIDLGGIENIIDFECTISPKICS